MKHTDETKRKMSATRKGRKLSDYHKARIKETHAHHWMGKKFSDEHRLKIKLAHIKRSEEMGTRLKPVPKHGSPEHLEKLRIAHLGQVAWNKNIKGYHTNRTSDNKNLKRGEEHHNWKGGVSSANDKLRKSVKYKIWRLHILERDDYTCQECGVRGGDLNADHIKPFALFPDLRFEPSNGRTLCVTCHKKTPTYGARVLTYTI